jgi:hypothetical protein
VIGFLGNPNFQSSFLGLVGILSFAYLLNSKADLKMRLAFLTLFLMSLFVIIKTNSQQGLIVLALGVGIVSVYRINFSKFRSTIPVLLGSGIPLFALSDRSISFTCNASRCFPNGVTQSNYKRK